MNRKDTANKITTLISDLRGLTGKHFITYSTGKPQRFQVMNAQGNTLGNLMKPQEFISYLESMLAVFTSIGTRPLDVDVPGRLERAIEDCHHYADTITNGTKEERLAIINEIGNTADDLEYIKFHVISSKGGANAQV